MKSHSQSKVDLSVSLCSHSSSLIYGAYSIHHSNLLSVLEPSLILLTLHPPSLTSTLPLPQAHTVATFSPPWWSVPVTQYLSASRRTVASQTEGSLRNGKLCILRILQVPRTYTLIETHLRHTVLRQLNTSL